MLPEVSITRTMSMPSLDTWVSSRPVCGRAIAVINSATATRRSPRTARRSQSVHGVLI